MFGFLKKARPSERLYSTSDLSRELKESPSLIIYHIKKLGIAPVRKFAGKNAYGKSALVSLSAFFEAKRKFEAVNKKQQISA